MRTEDLIMITQLFCIIDDKPGGFKKRKNLGVAKIQDITGFCIYYWH